MKIISIIIPLILLSTLLLYFLQTDTPPEEITPQFTSDCINNVYDIMPKNITLSKLENETGWFYNKISNPRVLITIFCTLTPNEKLGIATEVFDTDCKFSHITGTYQNSQAETVGRVDFRGEIISLNALPDTDRKKLGTNKTISLKDFAISNITINKCEWPAGLPHKQVFAFTTEIVDEMCKQDCEDFCSFQNNITSTPTYDKESGNCTCSCK